MTKAFLFYSITRIFIILFSIKSTRSSQKLHSIGADILEQMHTEEPRKCYLDLIASYIDELNFAETSEPIAVIDQESFGCRGVHLSCCSTFEKDFLITKFKNNVEKIHHIKDIFKDAIRVLNNINPTTFDQLKFHLMDKYEDVCKIKHIDMQLARSHLMNGQEQIFEKIDQVMGKRIQLKSSTICEFCDYNFHKNLMGGSTEIFLDEQTCDRFLEEDAKDYIDLMNILWELALIREGINCVYEHMMDPQTLLKNKIISLMNVNVSDSRVVLNDDGSAKVSVDSAPSRKLDLDYNNQAILLTEGSRSIIQYYAKEVLNSFEHMNLFDRETLPNLEEQTEINGLISHCKVVESLEDMKECQSLCKGYFNFDIIEEQIAPFLHQLVLSVNKYFYSTEKEMKKDSPKWRQQRTKDILDEGYITQLSFRHYLEPKIDSSETHTYKPVDISGLRLKVLFDHSLTPAEEFFIITPYTSYIEEFRFKGSTIWTALFVISSILLLF